MMSCLESVLPVDPHVHQFQLPITGASRWSSPGYPAVREEWRQYVKSLTGVVSRHSKEIDEYIQTHGPMTRPEVIERALTKLLSEV